MDKQRYEGRDNCESLIVGIIPSDNCSFYAGTRLSTAFSQLCPQRDRRQGELWSLKRHLLLKWPFQTSTREKKDLIFHHTSGSVLSRHLEYFVYLHTWSWLWALAIWIWVSGFSWLSWYVREMLFLFSVFFFPVLCWLCGKLQQSLGLATSENTNEFKGLVSLYRETLKWESMRGAHILY